MAVTQFMFGKALANLLGGEIAGDAFAVDYLSDNIVCRLHTNLYSPNLDTHETLADLTNEVAAGGGYSAGGVALAGKTITYTAANAWATQWAGSTSYAVGDIVRPTAGNGHLYRAIVAGQSAVGQPTWPTVSGQVVVDNGVTWAEIGRGLTQVDSNDPSWAASTITARYAVVAKDTGTPGTSPLLFLVDFGADVSSIAALFQVTVHALGWLTHSTP